MGIVSPHVGLVGLLGRLVEVVVLFNKFLHLREDRVQVTKLPLLSEALLSVNSHLRLDVGDFTPGKFKLTQWDLDEIKQIMQTLKKTNQHKKGTISVYEYLFIAMSYFFH